MSTPPVTIRPACGDDAALLASLGARTFAEAFRKLNAPEDMAAYIAQAFTISQMQRELAKRETIFLIASSPEESVGYAKLSAGETPGCIQEKRALALDRLYVIRSWWGLGIGDALIGRCLRDARQGGYAALWLSSWKANERANRFYRKWGFVAVGEQTFTVGSDIQEDLILIRRVGSASRPR